MKIMVSVALALLLVGCTQENKEEVKKEVAEVAKAPVKKTVQAAESVANKAEKVYEDSVKKAEEIVAVSVEKVEEVVADVSEKTKEVMADVTSTASGVDIYTSCKGCHGASAEKSALGKSKIIKGWDSAKTADALNGYKSGTYGGTMKGLMKGQVSKLSDSDIKAVSDYISKL